MEDLRVRMGDDDFYAFLKDYAALHAHKRVTSADFFAAVRAHTQADISDVIMDYFSGSY
jgi:aminopeptidase N